MRKNERELEGLVKEVEEMAEDSYNHPPLFELFVTMFSMSIAIMFFVYPDMLMANEVNPSKVYGIMVVVMPQTLWAVTFFVACMFKAIGLLLDSNWSRIFGLVMSSILYGTLAVCYAFVFPSIASIVFGYMFLFTIVSMQTVSYTSIRHRKGDKINSEGEFR